MAPGQLFPRRQRRNWSHSSMRVLEGVARPAPGFLERTLFLPHQCPFPLQLSLPGQRKTHLQHTMPPALPPMIILLGVWVWIFIVIKTSISSVFISLPGSSSNVSSSPLNSDSFLLA